MSKYFINNNPKHPCILHGVANCSSCTHYHELMENLCTSPPGRVMNRQELARYKTAIDILTTGVVNGTLKVLIPHDTVIEALTNIVFTDKQANRLAVYIETVSDFGEVNL